MSVWVVSGGEREVARLRESFAVYDDAREWMRLALLESAADTHVSLLIGDVGSGKTLTASFPVWPLSRLAGRSPFLRQTAILAGAVV